MFQAAPDYDAIESRAAMTGTQSVSMAAVPIAPSGWTDFRGPGRRGVGRAGMLDTDWGDSGLKLAWRRPAGATYGSFVADRGLLFALEQRRENEALVAYSALTGDQAWVSEWSGRYRDAPSGDGPRSTPVLGAAAVLGLGATGILRCVDARAGTLRWERNVLEAADTENLEYGLTGTPLVVDGLVIVPAGKPKDSGHGLLAFRLADGTVAWEALDDTASYSSPMLAEIAGRRQVLYLTATRLVGLDPASGKELWAAAWSQRNGYNCGQPMVVGPEEIAVSSAYGKGAALFRVTRVGSAWAVTEVWRTARFKNRFNPSVVHDGHIYGLDEGVLACLDAATGKRRWKGGRYGYGQVVSVGNHLLVLSDEGEVVLVRATPAKFDERARFTALEGLSVNLPAVAYGRLFVRNKREIACYLLERGRAVVESPVGRESPVETESPSRLGSPGTPSSR